MVVLESLVFVCLVNLAALEAIDKLVVLMLMLPLFRCKGACAQPAPYQDTPLLQERRSVVMEWLGAFANATLPACSNQ